MIAPLRRGHLAILAGLTLVVPATFAAALLSRPSLPSQGSPEFPVPSALVGSEIRTWPGPDFTLRLQPSEAGENLELTPQRAGLGPDLLIYLHPDRLALAPDPKGVPAGSQLLGTASPSSPRSMVLPKDSLPGAGVVFVYGLARQSVVARFDLDAEEVR